MNPQFLKICSYKIKNIFEAGIQGRPVRRETNFGVPDASTKFLEVQ